MFEFDTIDEMIVDKCQADLIKHNCFPVTFSCVTVSLHVALHGRPRSTLFCSIMLCGYRLPLEKSNSTQYLPTAYEPVLNATILVFRLIQLRLLQLH